MLLSLFFPLSERETRAFSLARPYLFSTAAFSSARSRSLSLSPTFSLVACPPQHLCVRHSLLLLSSRSRSPCPPLNFSPLLPFSLSLSLSFLESCTKNSIEIFPFFRSSRYCSHGSAVSIPEERGREREEIEEGLFSLFLSFSFYLSLPPVVFALLWTLVDCGKPRMPPRVHIRRRLRR